MHGKSGCFATQNSRFRNAKSKLSFFLRIIFTKLKSFSVSTNNKKKEIKSPIIYCRTFLKGKSEMCKTTS
ncbi:hypothetical protein CUB97_08300 [Prevotella intermedia]|uniref:Uncharacterized protein n=1 Tax=Prevotella intermedia TaxID=28131 RepID=A0A2M8MAH1_PREIN|nr:hypothetical protein CUB97_08300 [Prevotella intermedia]